MKNVYAIVSYIALRYYEYFFYILKNVIITTFNILRWSFKMFGPLQLHWHWDLTFCSASMPPALFQSVRFFGPSWMGFDICRSWILLWPGQHEGERHFWSGHGIDDNASVSGMVTSDIRLATFKTKSTDFLSKIFWWTIKKPSVIVFTR